MLCMLTKMIHKYTTGHGWIQIVTVLLALYLKILWFVTSIFTFLSCLAVAMACSNQFEQDWFETCFKIEVQEHRYLMEGGTASS